jgi:hypothetical protein
MTFSYHRSLSPMIGAILALALMEMFAIHLVAMAYWGWKVAIVLGIADASLVVMLVRLLLSFRTHPIVLADGVLTMRTGRRITVAIPLETISGLRENWSGADIKAPDVYNMALIAWPTVMIDLKQPMKRRRKTITSVAHCVDDPTGFRLAVQPMTRT